MFPPRGVKWFVVVSPAFPHAVTSTAIWCLQALGRETTYIIRKVNNDTKALLLRFSGWLFKSEKTIVLGGRKWGHTFENRDKELKSWGRTKPTQTAGLYVLLRRKSRAVRWDRSQRWHFWWLLGSSTSPIHLICSIYKANMWALC